MNGRTGITLLAITLLILASAPAFACAYFGGEWVLQTGEEIRARADGPIVLVTTGQASIDGILPSIDRDSFVVSLTEGESEVPGTGRLEDTEWATIKRFVFQPDAPLDPQLEYGLHITFTGGEFGPSERDLMVTIDDSEAVPVVTQFAGSEAQQGVDQVCCDLPAGACDDQKYCGGGPVACNVCWFQDWAYPVSTNFTWEVPLPQLYDFEIYRVDEDGSEELMSTVLTASQVSARVDFPEDWSGDRCIRVDATHFDTGDVLVGEVRCLESFATVERDPNAPVVPDNAVDCASTPVDEDGEPAVNPKAQTPGGCNTVDSPAGHGPWLLLLAFAAFARRRRVAVAHGGPRR